MERSVEVVRREAFCQADTFESIMAAQMQVVEACSVLNTPFGEYQGSAEEKIDGEKNAMLPLTREIGSFERQEYTVDNYGTIVVQKVHYSVPDTLVGRKVTAFLYSNVIKVHYQGRQVCEHGRTPVNGWKLDIMPYLRTLSRKPGIVAGSVALYMLRDDLRQISERHFSDCPADFIILPQKTQDKGLALDDIVGSERKIRRCGMRVTLEAFNQVLSGEKAEAKCVDMRIGISSRDIEKYAGDSLKYVAAIMDMGINNHDMAGYGTGM